MDNGESIPVLRTEPVSRLTLALFAGASGDHNPIHVDLDFARQAGMDDVFAHGMLSMAYLGRMLTDWIPQAALKEFKVRFTSITHIGDRMVCSGKVIEKFERNGEMLARVEVKAANQDGDVKLIGEAVVTI